MKDRSPWKLVKVCNKVQAEVKVIMGGVSQTEGSYLKGLNIIRLLRNKVPKDVLFYENVVFNAILYS